MSGEKLYQKTLNVVKDGIYLNIYQEYVPVIDKNLHEACSKMIPLFEFLQQLEGINLVYPNLICTTFDINLIKPNQNAKPGGPYKHKYHGISNQYENYCPPCSLNYLIDGIKHAIEYINKEKEGDALFFNVQSCNILCMFKNNNHKTLRKRITKSIRHEVFKRDKYKCVECGASKKDTTLHIDHIIPVSQGGTDELDNLQTLCETCNLSKSNRKWKAGE